MPTRLKLTFVRPSMAVTANSRFMAGIIGRNYGSHTIKM